jgi:NTE family protein
MLFFHRFSEVQNPFFDLAFFGGGSYELTTIQNDTSAFRDYGLIQSGSVFVGADTPLFPIYLGFGTASIGESSIYLSMGRIGRAPR